MTTEARETGIAVRVENRLFDFTNKSIDQALALAKVLCESSFVPATYKGKPGDAIVAIGYGQEVGLSPFAALQSVAVINGKPSIYGDAVPGVIQTHPKYEYHRLYSEGEGDNYTAICEMKRHGVPLHTVRFSVADAKKANLWGKAGPWQQYPKRMLGWRALGFAARDIFADKLKGLILAEEAQDIPRVVTEAEVMPRAVGESLPPTLAPYPKSPDIAATTTGKEQPELGLTAEQVGAIAEETQEGNRTEVSPLPGTDFITQADRKRLFALLKESGKSHDDLKDFLSLRGIKTTNEIPRLIYEVVADFCKEKKS